MKNKKTEKQPAIKIFVSNRIDLDSKQIPNPLFIPIRCGAFFDKRKNVTMLGDNTGDNISNQRMELSELTVLYWAWKNCNADYIGLQHYRRFLSFADKDFESGDLKIAYFGDMTDINLERIGILDEQKMRDEIKKYDLIIARKYNMYKDAGVRPGFINSIYESWTVNCPEFISKENFDLLFEQIKIDYPEYYDEAIAVKNGPEFLGFNCCIGTKNAINDLCSFLFTVLFNVQTKLIKNENFSEQNERVAAYMAEWLYTIWCFHALKQKKYKIKQTQLCGFMNSEAQHDFLPIVEAVPIVFEANRFNLPELVLSIQSLIDNANPSKMYEIILLLEYLPTNDEGASAERTLLERVKNQFDKYQNVVLRIYHPQDNIGKLNPQRNDTQIDHKKSYVTLLPWILSKYSKIIYLSEKALVKSDIAELYNEDLEEKNVGAVPDFYFMRTVLKNPNIDSSKIDFLDSPYSFSSTDVLVMNLEQLRKKFSKEKIISFFWENKELSKNDVFNHFYEHEIMPLDFSWNYYGIQDEWFNIMLRDSIPQKMKQLFKKVINPKIINYTIGWNVAPLLESPVWSYFWKIAKETDFYELLIQKWCLGLLPPPQVQQSKVSVVHKSFARRIVDKILPLGSRRRKALKKIMPRDSKQFNALRKIYHIFSN